MPLLHCGKCHHEFEAPTRYYQCDWCGSENTIVLEEETPLEKMLKDNDFWKKINVTLNQKQNK